MTLSEIIAEGNYHLIDVREEMELEMDGKIEKAHNIPLGEMEDRKQEITNLSGPKIFFCRSGVRSDKAVQYFKNQGLTDVYNGGSFDEVRTLIR